MKAIIKVIVLLFLLVLSVGVWADGYNIKIQIKGLQDTVCYLANYYGDKTYLADTAKVDTKGKFTFEGDSALPGGIYIVAGQSNNKYFEFIIDREQKFSVYTEAEDINGKIEFKNSTENDLFYDFIRFNMASRIEIETLRKGKSPGLDADSITKIDNRILELNSDLENYQDRIIIENPGSFVSVMLKAMQEPEVIDVPILENGREDSVYKYQYYKQHFWDNYDLSDDRLLRTPLFHKRLERYFSGVLYQHPDTIITEADIYISKTRDNKEVFKYSVWFLTYKFETSKIMGFDEIFVHMVDKYYLTGEAYWSDSTVVASLSKRADALRSILIGAKAPELILIDTSYTWHSLHYSIADYMILLFYEVDCNHCKNEIDTLKAWYDKNEIGFQVFAVNTDTSLTKWKNYILEKDLTWINVNGTRSITQDYHDLYDIRTTPTLFLLDEKKQIIAKRLKSEQLIPFLENYHQNRKQQGIE